MDSVTHIVVGAAIGEAMLGRKAGFRAATWGAVISTIPDLDILVNPFVDSVNELYFHRNITHSFFFAITAAPLLGLIIQKKSIISSKLAGKSGRYFHSWFSFHTF